MKLKAGQLKMQIQVGKLHLTRKDRMDLETKEIFPTSQNFQLR